MIGPLLWLLGKLLVLLSTVISYVLWPLTWLRDQIQASGSPVWADFAATAAIVSLLLFFLAAAFRTGWRALTVSLAIFAGIGIVIAVMGLDRGGLPVVDTRLWGGLLVTLVVSVTGHRRLDAGRHRAGAGAALDHSVDPDILDRLHRVLARRAADHGAVLRHLHAAAVPSGSFTVDGLVRALIGIALFAGAYQAEVIRGGLQAIPRGQGEAASALGLSWGKTTALIVMPQALRHVIPGLVNSFIALFKDTSLVSIVALFDLLGQLRAAFADPDWSTPTTLFTGFAFTGTDLLRLLFWHVALFAVRREPAERTQRN